jgi:hypothetical protein
MCTVVVLRRSDHRWPILVAANRDEMVDRPWLPPGRHWKDRPNVVGGLDELGGGAWLGINDEGVIAAVLNRKGTLGPETGKRSRGELVLEALDHADAVDAADALSHLDTSAYRPFNMVIADNRDSYWLRADGHSVKAFPLEDGVTMLTAFERNDMTDPRIKQFLPRFQKASPPDPDDGQWQAWQTLLATRTAQGLKTDEAGLTFQLDNGFGTRSSALLALPSVDHPEIEPVFLFAPGPPDQNRFRPVIL